MKTQSKVGVVLILCMIYVILLLQSQDSDMFFTISSGRDILSNNFVFNTHTNLPIIVQQWLYAVILAKFDDIGPIGDIMLVLIQNIILFVVSYIFIYRKTNDRYKSIVGPMLLTIVTGSYMINIRPQIITMILLLLQIIILDYYKSNKSKYKILIWLIPICIISANMHQAVFLYHIFVLLPFLIDNKKIDFKLFILSPILLLCSLITPYGIDGPLYILKTLQSNVFNKIHIAEIAPIDITSVLGISMIVVLIYVVYINYNHTSNIFINYYSICVFIFSMMSIRHLSILYIPLIYIYINLDLNKIKFKHSIYTYLSIIILNLLFILITINSIMSFKDIRLVDSSSVITNIDIPKNSSIFTTLNVGAYLEYEGYNVLLDARPELYTEEICGEDRISEYRLIEYGVNDKDMYVSDDKIIKALYKYDYVVLRKNSYSNRIVKEIGIKIKETDYFIVWKLEK